MFLVILRQKCTFPPQLRNNLTHFCGGLFKVILVIAAFPVFLLVVAVGRDVHHIRWWKNQTKLCRSRIADPGLSLHLQQEGTKTANSNVASLMEWRHSTHAGCVSGGAATQPSLPNSGVHQ